MKETFLNEELIGDTMREIFERRFIRPYKGNTCNSTEANLNENEKSKDTHSSTSQTRSES